VITSLAHVSLYVRDYDEAIRFFTGTLGLELRDDRPYGPSFRWVTVGAKGQRGVDIVLHVPHEGDGATMIGRQPGMVFFTDDCRVEVESLRAQGVEVTQGPDEVPWGVQAVLRDLYGNAHVLVEPSPFALPPGAVD
jgi:catechol 2,3-dioxygenase-like lactoylglutathione lyase family enzyme